VGLSVALRSFRSSGDLPGAGREERAGLQGQMHDELGAAIASGALAPHRSSVAMDRYASKARTRRKWGHSLTSAHCVSVHRVSVREEQGISEGEPTLIYIVLGEVRA